MSYFGYRQIFGPLVRNKIRNVQDRKNLPNKLPFILAANHEGFLDAPALVMFILYHYNKPTYYLTKKYMWRWWGGPVAGFMLGMIPVHPGRKADALSEAVRMVNKGNIIGIFPEGGRNPQKDLRKGKTGAVRLALETGIPLIPIGIKNHTGYSLFVAIKNYWQKDKFIDISVGQPVDLTEFKNKPIDKPLLEAATRKLMLAIGNLCGKTYSC